MKFIATHKKMLVLLLVIVVAVGVAFAWHQHANNHTIEQPGGPVTLSGPTQQERDEANAKKQQLVEQQEAIDQQNSQSGKKQVTPVISYVDQNGLNAYVAGVFEDGGTCTATFKHGTLAFQKTSSGFQDATTTGCSPIDLSSSDFDAAGTWSVTVSYASPTAAGTSKATSFTVK